MSIYNIEELKLKGQDMLYERKYYKFMTSEEKEKMKDLNQ